MQRLRRGDKVGVIAGKFRGQSGVVREILREANRVRIEGIAPIRRHLKPKADPKVPNGGIIERLGSVHVSNVLPLCPKTGRPTRVTISVREDGRRVRVAKVSGEELPDKPGAVG